MFGMYFYTIVDFSIVCMYKHLLVILLLLLLDMTHQISCFQAYKHGAIERSDAICILSFTIRVPVDISWLYFPTVLMSHCLKPP